MKTAKLLCLLTSIALTATLGTALAQGDPVKGKKLSKKCLACHTMNEGGKNKLGPNLYGILNQPAGKVEGYKYSKVMTNSGIVWDESTFNSFITKPKKLIKGTKMSFRGMKKAGQRSDLLAYFKTLGAAKQVTGVGDANNGIKVATKHCTVCHSFVKGGKQVFGPNLFDIYGKKAAAIDGYKYSAALENSGLVWDDKNLASFLSDPERFVVGTKARFPGLKSNQEKADILAYIKTLN